MKTLVADRSCGAGAVSVQCLECGKMVQLNEALIDPEGPAFMAYYHRKCVPFEDYDVRTVNWDGRFEEP